jgi:hypothetical protein
MDGNANVTLTDLLKTGQVIFAPNKTGFTFHIHETLDNLGEGNHTLRVYSQDVAGEEMSSSVEFTIDTQYRYPEILILSPQNKTYTSTELPLTFTSDEIIISAHYMLDNRVGNTSLIGNTTLTGLSEGAHKITVTIWTERGYASQTTYFSVNSGNDYENAEPETFPTVAVVAVSGAVAVALVGIGLWVYFKKRKR